MWSQNTWVSPGHCDGEQSWRCSSGLWKDRDVDHFVMPWYRISFMWLLTLLLVGVLFALTPLGVDEESLGELGRGSWDFCLAWNLLTNQISLCRAESFIPGRMLSLCILFALVLILRSVLLLLFFFFFLATFLTCESTRTWDWTCATAATKRQGSDNHPVLNWLSHRGTP